MAMTKIFKSKHMFRLDKSLQQIHILCLPQLFFNRVQYTALVDRGGGGGGVVGVQGVRSPPPLKNNVKGFNPKYKIIS